MKLYTIALLAIAAAPGLGAATVFDIGGETPALVRTGDSLVFEVFDRSFRSGAASFGLPADVTGVGFSLAAVPGTPAGTFSGTIASADGSVSIGAGGPLTFEDGWISNSVYSGPISVVQVSWHLSRMLSQEIFAGGSARLTLRNDGPNVTVGLEGYTLRQDLLVSLTGDSLSVGGTVGSVYLEPASRTFKLQALGGSLGPDAFAEAPEPGSSVMCLGAALIFCTVSICLQRLSKARQ